MRSRKADQQQYDPTLVGYARVSTDEQSLDMQIAALVRAGVDPANIFSETVSGVATKRPQRDFAVRQCRRGSTLVVWKLDRAGRSLLDLLTFIQGLHKEGIGFRSLQDSIDTTTPIGNVMLAILGAFAQFERDLIAQRTKAGVARAKERGVKFGQPSKWTPETIRKVEAGIRAGKRVAEVALDAGLAEATIRLRYNASALEQLRAKGKK